jgi:AcrR family transcriptional regulator
VTRLDPETRRTQIIEAATRLFEARDPTEVPFEEIADAAGVSRALVYNYFGDRGGLLAAVLLHHFDGVNAHLARAAQPGMAPSERIRAIVAAYLEFAAEHPGAWRLLRVARTDHPRVQEARRQRMREIAAALGGTDEALIVAYAITGLIEEATIEWLQSGNPGVEAVVDLIHDLLWAGLGSLGPHGITLAAR